MATLEKSKQLGIAFTFGGVALIALFSIAILIEDPNDLLVTIARVTLALACAGIAAVIPGFIDLRFSHGTIALIRSGGAIAVFVLVYFFNPPGLLSASTVGPNPDIPPSPEKPYEPAANEWLEKIDRGDYASAYESASRVLKERYDKELIVRLYGDYLVPLGTLKERTLMRVNSVTSLPNGDSGNFRIMVYRSKFARGMDQIEMLVLSAEDGDWVVQSHTYYDPPEV